MTAIPNLPSEEAGPVFYVFAREGETPDSPLALTTGRGPAGDRLAYWDETDGDRDSKQVLWARYSQTLSGSGRPVGRPLDGRLHPGRQYGTMLHRYCGLGACPARTEDGRHLHLVTDDERLETGAVRTVHPPVCLDHAAAAANSPRFRGGYTALLVRTSAISGVLGTPCRPAGLGVRLSSGGQQFVPYSEKEARRWVLAFGLVRDLTDYEVIADLDEFLLESAADRLAGPSPSALPAGAVRMGAGARVAAVRSRVRRHQVVP
ncbi:hypothetical protein ABT389_17100 [Streptomyces bacillaris]|uniref:hypothetical protein n=1 Tax=Streptomyces bacillaris TaxID=68179 RepID=UPI0033573CCB